MFSSCKCKIHECTNLAISSFDENGNILETQDGYCLKHDSDGEKKSQQIIEYIKTHDTIVGLNANYISFENIDISNKKFFCCNFQHCSFSNITGNNILQRMCIYDFSTFTDCSFLNTNIIYCSFAGSNFVHAIFTGSDLIHNNFNGITVYQSSFDDCDFYNTRFIKAIFFTVSMNNCNLKKTIFYESVRDNVSFKLSNTREAIIDREGLVHDLTTYNLSTHLNEIEK